MAPKPGKNSLCGQCREDFVKSSNAISCELCEFWFHPDCQDINLDTFKILSNKKTRCHWFCDRCDSHVISTIKSLRVLEAKVEELEGKIGNIEEKLLGLKSNGITSNGKVSKQSLQVLYETDKYSQAGLALFLRITGIPVIEDVSLSKQILDIGTVLGIDVVDSDIQCYRLFKPKPGIIPPVIVKCNSENVRLDFLKKSKLLKGIETYRKCFIREELTPLRARLFSYCRKLNSLNYVSTRGGKIICYRKKDLNSVDTVGMNTPVVVSNPNDLEKLGLENIDYKELGLGDCIAAA